MEYFTGKLYANCAVFSFSCKFKMHLFPFINSNSFFSCCLELNCVMQPLLICVLALTVVRLSFFITMLSV